MHCFLLLSSIFSFFFIEIKILPNFFTLHIVQIGEKKNEHEHREIRITNTNCFSMQKRKKRKIEHISFEGGLNIASDFWELHSLQGVSKVSRIVSVNIAMEKKRRKHRENPLL